MISWVARKSRSFWSLPLFIKLWLFPVWCLLGFARLAVLFISFRSIAIYLGQDRGTAACLPILPPAKLSSARLVGRTIRLAARYAPWEANCFAQAIVAAFLLRMFKIPYSIFFGLRNEDLILKEMDAHAWTMSGCIAVTGGNSFGNFTVVGTFLKWD